MSYGGVFATHAAPCVFAGFLSQVCDLLAGRGNNNNNSWKAGCSCRGELVLLCAGQTPRKGSLLVMPPGLGWIRMARIVVARPASSPSLQEKRHGKHSTGKPTKQRVASDRFPHQCSSGILKGFTMAHTQHAGQDNGQNGASQMTIHIWEMMRSSGRK